MKRHPVLQDLSRDHFFALQHAQRLRRAAGDAAGLAFDAFLHFWREHMVQHFREEEEVLLPLFTRRRAATDPAVVAVLVEHVDIARYALDADVRAPEAAARRGAAAARELGDLIERHVRHEENVLFPMVEEALSDRELDEPGARLAAFPGSAGAAAPP
jgi:hemerythrin-like domain-containing protein